MPPAPNPKESALLLAVLALVLAAWVAPSLSQPPHAHDFADGRTLWGVPCTLDVLSNLPFLLAGLLGLLLTARAPRGVIPPAERACAVLFFLGLVLTAGGSAWYHLAPADAGLAVDRAAMSIAFAGLLGLAAATRVSARAGGATAGALLVLGPASVLAWAVSGNVLPWALVQFGGIALLLAMMALGRVPASVLQVRWSLVLLAYAVAKLFEAQDHAIYAATGELLSGHSLKHVAAAFAAWPVLAAVAAQAAGHNRREPVAQAA